MIRASAVVLASVLVSALVACSGDVSDSADGAGTSDSNVSALPAFTPPAWENGTSCGRTPDIQVYKYSVDTYVFRQSICTTFEAPFIYLLLGDKKAIMIDSGNRRDSDGGLVDLKTPVETAIADFTKARGLEAQPELIVAHSHSHGDHVSGDPMFRSRPNTKVVGYQPREVAQFFGLGQWPEGSAAFDLGNRTLDVVPIPGHEASHIAVYDRTTQFLFTGDSLYPGRLYVSSWGEYQKSTQRLVTWMETNDVPVRVVLGAHIEMSNAPGDDYEFEAPQHLDEHTMVQPKERLKELSTAMQSLATPKEDVHPHFVIFPL